MATRISAISSSISRSLPRCYVRRPPSRTLTTFPKPRLCPLWSSSFFLCLHRKSTARPRISPVRSFSSAAVSDPPRMTASVDESLRDNPLLNDFDFPPFDCIQADHVRPGIRPLLKKLEGELAELESTVEPSWPKLVEPLEKIIDRLAVIWGAVNHLKAVKDTPELRSAIEEVQHEKVKFELKLRQSKPIYNAFKAIKESPDWAALSDARKRIVESENGPWVITLDAPSFMSVMQHAKNRALRKEVYRAYVTRASSGELDNTSIIDILKLRLEKAKLLGYNNYAEVSMATKMATIDKAEELLEKLRTASWDAAVKDLEELKQFSKDQGAPEANDLNHWDTSFWSERLSESKYEINEEELRPYFSLPKVMDGLFNLAKMLFEITIEAADGLAPVWNNDVRFYCVKDSSGSHIAYFYFDPYSCPSEKRGGAWMDEVFARSHVLSQDGASARLPVAHMVCNQMPPVGNKPSLMTFREVETVFHEFGHALQHMLTKQDEGLVAGIRGIEWDAVELPSQFYGKLVLPQGYLDEHSQALRNRREPPRGYIFEASCSQDFPCRLPKSPPIRAASVDLELHTKYVPGGSESIYDVDRRVSQKTQVIPPLPEDRFLCGFSHIFAAGYYSYKWAEVLSADAFSAFEDAGLNDDKAVKETGHKFRETILALGGGKAPLEVFVEFRGREPSPEPLLRHNGLLAVSA